MREGPPAEEFGPYLVYEQIGMGGMAEVHRAVAKGSDARRSVALKRMLSHIASSEEMVKSFVREARLASYLRHQNVPQTYDLGKVGDVYFIAMELITGRNLREVLKHCAKTTGPMPVRIALNILNQICAALDYAHNLCDDTGAPLGIIHRDVSPSNVIVSEVGVTKLIDFGIAKVSGAGMQTMSGTLKGKFAYMAPEYFAGQIDARADLFAIGVIAHELLTNRPLFSGRDDTDTMIRVRSMAIAPPSKKNPLVPPEIDDIVMTALARDPDRRWQHATALSRALTTLTRRLDLVASNTQVVQWLDWAFSHAAGTPPPGERPDEQTATDTETETATENRAMREMSDEPSISIEGGTAQLLTINQKSTLVTPRRDSSPSIQIPADSDTPVYVPPQPSSPMRAAASSGPEVTVRGSALGPGSKPGAVAAPVMRPSSPNPMPAAPPPPPPLHPATPWPMASAPPAERPAATVLGTSAPPSRAGRITSAPANHPNGAPMSAALLAHLNAAQGLTAPAAPVPSPAPGRPPSLPGGSGGQAAPFAAPRPRPPTAAPPPSYDAARSAMRPHDGAQPPAPAAAAPPLRDRRWVAVAMTLLAAAIAAITVYVVLGS